MKSEESAPFGDHCPGKGSKISVCIAAYNEAACIGRLLDQLISESVADVDEILVCANGCEDGTEEVVDGYRTKDSRVVLFASQKGKPAAWNTLMRAARNDLRVFLDADVELAPSFLGGLRTVARSEPLVAIVAARDLPKVPVAGFWPRLVALANRPFGFDYVCGRGYMLRRSAMAGIARPMASQGDSVVAEMPLHVLHEDFWLEVYLGRSRIALAREARVYYEPGNLSDLLKSRARLRIARRQVAAMMPEEFIQWRKDFRGSSSLFVRVWRRLRTMDDFWDAAYCAAGLAARTVLLVFNQGSIRRMESAMLREMSVEGGQAVLAGSGRLNKIAID